LVYWGRAGRAGLSLQRTGILVVTTPLYQLKAEFFKTLGHPARIRILELLAEGEMAVGEMLPIVGVEASNLSQQLAVLRRAGVVVTRKQGNAVIYSMASADMGELMGIARSVLTGLLTDQADLLKDLQAVPATRAGAGRS
jgi:DNA-binding transcriptional ArsR family regulator